MGIGSSAKYGFVAFLWRNITRLYQTPKAKSKIYYFSRENLNKLDANLTARFT